MRKRKDNVLSAQSNLNTISFEFQGGYVGAACKQLRSEGKRTTVTRGDVTEFSRRSRHRILKMFAKLDWKRRKAIFITLTYPEAYPHPKRAKQHLRAFLKRLSRYFHAPGNKYAAIWRMEFQERGAPHFHIILVDLPFVPKEDIQQMWGEVIGYEKPFTRIELCRNKRKTMYYVSKYLAKSEWKKKSGKWVFCGFIYVPYPSASTDESSIGRFWGAENAEYLPFAGGHSFTIQADFRSLYQLKRYARKVWRRTNSSAYRGFSLFVDSAARWLELFQQVLRDEFMYDLELVRVT